MLAIWPFEETADGEGKTIYIDDIKVEGPMVNDMGVRAMPDNSLTGDVVVTGVIGKGTYQNTWDGDWHSEAYDDYAVLASKLAADALTLDVRGAGRWNEDWDVIKTKCPGIKIILTDEDMTAISSVRHSHSKKNEIYDLQGRRVAHPAKGLYISDGKKKLAK